MPFAFCHYLYLHTKQTNFSHLRYLIQYELKIVSINYILCLLPFEFCHQFCSVLSLFCFHLEALCLFVAIHVHACIQLLFMLQVVRRASEIFCRLHFNSKSESKTREKKCADCEWQKVISLMLEMLCAFVQFYFHRVERNEKRSWCLCWSTIFWLMRKWTFQFTIEIQNYIRQQRQM